jgi:hypothetical protein
MASMENSDTWGCSGTINYGKPPFFMGKSTISVAMLNSYVSLPERK